MTWESALGQIGYLLLETAVFAAFAAPAIAFGLKQSGVRANGFGLRDAWLAIAVILRFMLIAAPLVAIALMGIFPFSLSVVAGIPLEFEQITTWSMMALALFALLYLYVRLWFARAHSLRDGRLRFFASWPLTRGLFWVVFLYSVLVLVLTTGFTTLVDMWVAPLLPQTPTEEGWLLAFHPPTALYLGVTAASHIAATLYMGAVEAKAFADLVPAGEPAA